MTTKEKIFEVSTELFSERGYNVVNMREIAAKVGITEGAIYRHYASKAEILDEILEAYRKKHEHYLMSRKQIEVYSKTHTPRQLLEHFVTFFSADDQPFISSALRIICRENLINPTARDILNVEVYNYLADLIKYTLDLLIEQEGIPQMETTAFSLSWAQAMVANAYRWASAYQDEEMAAKMHKDYLVMSNWMIEIALTGKVPG